MAKEYTNHFNSKTPKIYQNWDFGLKIYHLATLLLCAFGKRTYGPPEVSGYENAACVRRL
jgi:hypothetical protein